MDLRPVPQQTIARVTTRSSAGGRATPACSMYMYDDDDEDTTYPVGVIDYFSKPLVADTASGCSCNCALGLCSSADICSHNDCTGKSEFETVVARKEIFQHHDNLQRLNQRDEVCSVKYVSEDHNSNKIRGCSCKDVSGDCICVKRDYNAIIQKNNSEYFDESVSCDSEDETRIADHDSEGSERGFAMDWQTQEYNSLVYDRNTEQFDEALSVSSGEEVVAKKEIKESGQCFSCDPSVHVPKNAEINNCRVPFASETLPAVSISKLIDFIDDGYKRERTEDRFIDRMQLGHSENVHDELHLGRYSSTEGSPLLHYATEKAVSKTDFETLGSSHCGFQTDTSCQTHYQGNCSDDSDDSSKVCNDNFKENGRYQSFACYGDGGLKSDRGTGDWLALEHSSLHSNERNFSVPCYNLVRHGEEVEFDHQTLMPIRSKHRRRLLKAEDVVKSDDIPNYRGNRCVEEILRFINGSDEESKENVNISKSTVKIGRKKKKKSKTELSIKDPSDALLASNSDLLKKLPCDRTLSLGCSLDDHEVTEKAMPTCNKTAAEVKSSSCTVSNDVVCLTEKVSSFDSKHGRHKISSLPNKKVIAAVRNSTESKVVDSGNKSFKKSSSASHGSVGGTLLQYLSLGETSREKQTEEKFTLVTKKKKAKSRHSGKSDDTMLHQIKHSNSKLSHDTSLLPCNSKINNHMQSCDTKNVSCALHSNGLSSVNQPIWTGTSSHKRKSLPDVSLKSVVDLTLPVEGSRSDFEHHGSVIKRREESVQVSLEDFTNKRPKSTKQKNKSNSAKPNAELMCSSSTANANAVTAEMRLSMPVQLTVGNAEVPFSSSNKAKDDELNSSTVEHQATIANNSLPTVVNDSHQDSLNVHQNVFVESITCVEQVEMQQISTVLLPGDTNRKNSTNLNDEILGTSSVNSLDVSSARTEELLTELVHNTSLENPCESFVDQPFKSSHNVCLSPGNDISAAVVGQHFLNDVPQFVQEPVAMSYGQCSFNDADNRQEPVIFLDGQHGSGLGLGEADLGITFGYDSDDCETDHCELISSSNPSSTVSTQEIAPTSSAHCVLIPHDPGAMDDRFVPDAPLGTGTIGQDDCGIQSTPCCPPICKPTFLVYPNAHIFPVMPFAYVPCAPFLPPSVGFAHHVVGPPVGIVPPTILSCAAKDDDLDETAHVKAEFTDQSDLCLTTSVDLYDDAAVTIEPLTELTKGSCIQAAGTNIQKSAPGYRDHQLFDLLSAARFLHSEYWKVLMAEAKGDGSVVRYCDDLDD